MKRKTNDFLKCSVCGEEDYGDYINTIDGKHYCQGCAEEFEDENFETMCDECFGEVKP